MRLMPSSSPVSPPPTPAGSGLSDFAPPWVLAFVERHSELECDVDPAGRWGAGAAVFSGGREHRYLLSRTWEPTRPTVVFVMLNPSTADAFALDPTVRRCAGFSQSWGAGSLIVANIFALRSTNPTALYAHPDPVGPLNDEALAALPGVSRTLVAAWGNHGALNGRGEAVRRVLNGEGLPALVCFGVTKKKFPRHPLFVPGVTVPVPYA
jgi:hypothetical protein